MTVASIVRKKTMRPPKRSVQIPSGTRASEPDKTGAAAIRPNSVSERPSCVLSGMPRIANIIQIAKQMVNAKVLDHNTRQPRGSVVAAAAVKTGGGGRDLAGDLPGDLPEALREAVMVRACRLSLRCNGNRLQD